jgi:4-amino-4-deoxy-L-arabinose transferase-like glycosyltransferase
VAAFSVLLHVVVNATSAYGFHRDEFLYFAMGRHLDLWRMDFPPFIALVANAQLQALGNSVVAVRVAPALAGAALIFLAALLARAMGGGRFAQALAMLSVLLHPLFLRASTLFQPVVFDQLWWTLGYFALVRLARDASPRWWLTLGAAAGLGLLTKFSILFFGVGVVVAMLVTPLRDALRTRWPWVALLVALILGAPSIVGQIALDWPLREQMAGLQEAQLARVTWGEFLGTQFVFGPATLLAGAGLAVLLGGRLREFRVIGVATLTSFVLLLLLHGKPYYAGPIYPALFAAGAVLVESVRAPSGARVLRWSTAGIIAA